MVDRVLFHREHHPELSIGVVTFSAAQEEAVIGARSRRSPRSTRPRRLLDDHDRLDGFFVKNLENVQGDERDIIIFSIGYGPDETGKFTMNFGPDQPRGRWRRLNVAITRARRRVEVVSSFPAADIRESAERGPRATSSATSTSPSAGPRRSRVERATTAGRRRPESPFEEDVMRVLSGLGLRRRSRRSAAPATGSTSPSVTPTDRASTCSASSATAPPTTPRHRARPRPASAAFSAAWAGTCTGSGPSPGTATVARPSDCAAPSRPRSRASDRLG